MDPPFGDVPPRAGFKSPRTHKFPISARFRACRIVTRAQAPASARRSAFRAFLFLPGQGFAAGLACFTVTVLAVSVARACRAAAAGFQVRVISCSRRYADHLATGWRCP